MRTISATEFKSKCLTLMDEVAKSGDPIVITKRGRPVAQLGPVVPKRKTLYGAMEGRIRILGDIMEPIDVKWEALDC
jgi:prevent-host-death family protein